MKRTYQTIFRKEPDGGYTALIPALPGCISYGKNLKEAKKMIAEAMQGYLESLEKHGGTYSTGYFSHSDDHDQNTVYSVGTALACLCLRCRFLPPKDCSKL